MFRRAIAWIFLTFVQADDLNLYTVDSDGTMRFNEQKLGDDKIFEMLNRNEISDLAGICFNNQNLTSIPLNLGEKFPNLKRLYFSSNNISQIDKEAFRGLEKLESLDLSSNEIEKVNIDAFKELPNLKELNLINNKLTILEMDKLPRSLNIPKLYLVELDKSNFRTPLQETNVFILSTKSNKDLIDLNKIENDCPICYDELVKEESDEPLAILSHHDPNGSILHCFHRDCLVRSMNNATSRCPICRKSFKIEDDLRARFLLEKVFKIDLKDATKEEILSLLTEIYEINSNGMIAEFFDEKFFKGALKDIIFYDKVFKNAEFKDPLRDVIEFKKLKEKTEPEKIMKYLKILIKRPNCSSSIVNRVENEIIKNNISSRIKSLDLSGRCITDDNIDSFTSLIDKLPYLESVDLSNNEIDDAGITKLYTALAKCRNLKKLDVSKTKIQNKKQEELANLIKNRKNHRRITQK